MDEDHQNTSIKALNIMNLGGTVHINKTGCCVFLGCLVIFFIYMLSGKSEEQKPQPTQVNLRKLLAVAIRAAEAGGKEVVAVKNDLVIESKGKTKEGANDSVTTADFRSHCVMLHNLKERFPTLDIVSEEANTICNEKSKVEDVVLDEELRDDWVDEKFVKVWIDPLDATQEYTEKLYDYVTTMVCVAVHGEPLIGIIHKPFSKETTWAWVGKKKSSDLTKPQETDKKELKFIVSRSHTGIAKKLIEEKFKGQKIEVISAGGAGYKVLEIVNARADVYIHVTAIKKWDICAGNAILNAVGGQMTTRKDQLIDYADSDNPVNEEGLVATLRNRDVNVKL